MRGWSFVIVAGGRGERFGKRLKQIEDLGGIPLWEWSARVALSLANEGVREVILVTPPGMENHFDLSLSPVKEFVKIVPGGDLRQGSVLSGLRSSSYEMVIVHDAARPFVSDLLCKRVMAEAEGKGAAVPLLPVSDALKLMDGDAVTRPIERRDLRAVQTPQAYPRLELKGVLENCSVNIDDESQAWVGSGKKIGWTAGEPLNFKITYPEDLNMARMIEHGSGDEYSGLGYDIHPLRPAVPLVIGGVSIPSRLGLSGHSDGDLLCHAISDALLGASGFPDIGTIFPATERSYRGAYSRDLLAEVVRIIGAKGFSVISVDAVVNAQVPRLAPWIDKIKESLNKVLFRCGEGNLSIKAKSGEGIGEVGNGEAIACFAIARVRKIRCPSVSYAPVTRNEL